MNIVDSSYIIVVLANEPLVADTAFAAVLSTDSGRLGTDNLRMFVLSSRSRFAPSIRSVLPVLDRRERPETSLVMLAYLR